MSLNKKGERKGIKQMKYIRKGSLILLFLLFVMFLSVPAHAEGQKEKGALIRWWENLRARVSGSKVVPAEEAAEEVKVADIEERIEVKEEKKKTPGEKKIPSKTEMIETIERRLRVFSEIVDMIPGLSRKEKVGAEDAEYRYAPPGNVPMKLEELDEKTLRNLYVKINQQATILNTERINRQLRQQEQLRRLQELQRTTPQVPAGPPQQPPARPPTPPSAPPRPPAAPLDRR